MSLVRVEYTDDAGQKRVVVGENQQQKLALAIKENRLSGAAGSVASSTSSDVISPTSTDGRPPDLAPAAVPEPGEGPKAPASQGAAIQLAPSGLAAVAMAPDRAPAWLQEQMEHMIPGAGVTASVQADHNLTQVHVVVAYDNSVIHGHVNVAGRKPDAKTTIMAVASGPDQPAGSARVNENGDYSIEGLKPGDYSVTIHVLEWNGASARSATKTLPATVGKNSVTQLSFDIDLNAKLDDR